MSKGILALLGVAGKQSSRREGLLFVLGLTLFAIVSGLVLKALSAPKWLAIVVLVVFGLGVSVWLDIRRSGKSSS